MGKMKHLEEALQEALVFLRKERLQYLIWWIYDFTREEKQGGEWRAY